MAVVEIPVKVVGDQSWILVYIFNIGVVPFTSGIGAFNINCCVIAHVRWR